MNTNPKAPQCNGIYESKPTPNTNRLHPIEIINSYIFTFLKLNNGMYLDLTATIYARRHLIIITFNPIKPPVLDPKSSKVDGLAFLGLSLTRNSPQGHPDSLTHQTSFDLNEVLDRDYEFVASTNDDGWLVGGGEPGPPLTYKLAAKDSSHVEIMRIGTYRPEWGGVAQQDIIEYVVLDAFVWCCLNLMYCDSFHPTLVLLDLERS